MTEGAWECTYLSTSGLYFGHLKFSVTPTNIFEMEVPLAYITWELVLCPFQRNETINIDL